MPKKKLTKAQVKAAFGLTWRALSKLLVDKIAASDSRVTMSVTKLVAMQKEIRNAQNRVK